MIRIKCFNIAKQVIEEATSQSGGEMQIDDDRYNNFKAFCDKVDIVAGMIGATAMSVEVYEPDFNIGIEVECDEDITDSQHAAIRATLGDIEGVYFANGEEGNYIVGVIHPGVWKK